MFGDFNTKKICKHQPASLSGSFRWQASFPASSPVCLHVYSSDLLHCPCWPSGYCKNTNSYSDVTSCLLPRRHFRQASADFLISFLSLSRASVLLTPMISIMLLFSALTEASVPWHPTNQRGTSPSRDYYILKATQLWHVTAVAGLNPPLSPGIGFLQIGTQFFLTKSSQDQVL